LFNVGYTKSGWIASRFWFRWSEVFKEKRFLRGNAEGPRREGERMTLILILIILMLVFGFGGYRLGPGVGYYGGGGISLILLIVIILLLLRVI
jgi:Protein of unknown function (DUF3309)